MLHSVNSRSSVLSSAAFCQDWPSASALFGSYGLTVGFLPLRWRLLTFWACLPLFCYRLKVTAPPPPNRACLRVRSSLGQEKPTRSFLQHGVRLQLLCSPTFGREMTRTPPLVPLRGTCLINFLPFPPMLLHCRHIQPSASRFSKCRCQIKD